MAKRTKAFRHFTLKKPTDPEAVPCGPYLLLGDILDGARYVLRRRTEAGVAKRTDLILRKIHEFMETYGPHLPDYITLEDAGVLDALVLPKRRYQFRRTEEENAQGLPWEAEKGWLAAEDLAILALHKVDEAADAIATAGEDGLVVAARYLLDGYRSLLLAERYGGRSIQTHKEFEQSKTMYAAAKKEYLALLKRKAPSGGRKELRDLRRVVERLCDEFRNAHPEATNYSITKQITDLYAEANEVFQDLPELSGKSWASYFETFRRWVDAHAPSEQPFLGLSDLDFVRKAIHNVGFQIYSPPPFHNHSPPCSPVCVTG